MIIDYFVGIKVYNMQHTFDADKPIDHKDKDRFQRYQFAARIAQTIVGRQSIDGIVMGVYGAWGEGKTSVLNFIDSELQGVSTILTLRFNPWRYNDEESLIKNFFNSIVDVLGKSLDTKTEKVASFVAKYGNVASIFKLPDVSPLGKAFSDRDLEELKERTNKFLQDCGFKLVIFIDDIDRLDKQEVYTIFKLVKLNADFVNTIYVLSFDDIMVASAIGERFGGGGAVSGESFLEKIIQIPLRIPPAQPLALKRYCFDLIERAINENGIEITQSETEDFVYHFSEGVMSRLTNPRLAVRYGNSLSFVLPLLKGEVNIPDLLLIEALRIFYPKHYQFVRKNPEYFSGTYTVSGVIRDSKELQEKKDSIKRRLSELSADFSEKDQQSALFLIRVLFPRLNGVYNDISFSGGEASWTKQKRIVAPQYFNRYFTYCVTDGEISDVVFDGFVKSLNDLDTVTIEEKLKDLIKLSSADTLISKFRSFEADISGDGGVKLIQALSRCSELFPMNDFLLSFGAMAAQAQVSIFIHNVLLNYDNQQRRYEIIVGAVANASTYEFSIELLRWLRPGKIDSGEPFDETNYRNLWKVLRRRVLQDCGDVPIFRKFPNGLIQRVVREWAESDLAQLREYFTKAMSSPDMAVDIIRWFTPTGRSSSKPEYFLIDLSEEQYKYFTDFVNKDELHRNIRALYGSEVDQEDVQFYDFQNKQTDINILRQFEHWYQREKLSIDSVAQGDED